jgi:hypothetical protein
MGAKNKKRESRRALKTRLTRSLLLFVWTLEFNKKGLRHP